VSLSIPLSAVPSQTLDISPANQPTTLTLTTRYSSEEQAYKLFLDIAVNGADIISGVICRDRVMLIQLAYLGYQGDFVFVDTQSETDPVYTGLGVQYLLFYLFPQDIGFAQLSGTIDVTSV
jgi:hypothetical protein